MAIVLRFCFFFWLAMNAFIAFALDIHALSDNSNIYLIIFEAVLAVLCTIRCKQLHLELDF